MRSTSAARIRLTSSGLMPLLVAPAPDRLADARRRADAEVGLDQNVLEIVERVGVELALGEDVGDAAPRWRDRRAREARSGGAEASSASRGAARRAHRRAAGRRARSVGSGGGAESGDGGVLGAAGADDAAARPNQRRKPASVFSHRLRST